VSTMPAVVLKMGVEAPYLIDSLIPQYREEGEVLVMGLNVMDDNEKICCRKSSRHTYENVILPVYFFGSVPPNVISPFCEAQSAFTERLGGSGNNAR
jgi:hypothetical protein